MSYWRPEYRLCGPRAGTSWIWSMISKEWTGSIKHFKQDRVIWKSWRIKLVYVSYYMICIAGITYRSLSCWTWGLSGEESDKMRPMEGDIWKVPSRVWPFSWALHNLLRYKVATVVPSSARNKGPLASSHSAPERTLQCHAALLLCRRDVSVLYNL